MKKFLSILALAIFASVTHAQAGELDDESQVTNAQRFAAELPQTLVVKKDQTGNVSVFHSAEKLSAGAPIDTNTLKFEAVANTTPPKELDRDSSASGWYFWWNFSYSYSYPSYYYYNYTYSYSYSYTYSYRPYYSYYSPYENCNYYYYGWRW